MFGQGVEGSQPNLTQDVTHLRDLAGIDGYDLAISCERGWRLHEGKISIGGSHTRISTDRSLGFNDGKRGKDNARACAWREA